jgi:hypothetical protein
MAAARSKLQRISIVTTAIDEGNQLRRLARPNERFTPPRNLSTARTTLPQLELAAYIQENSKAERW